MLRRALVFSLPIIAALVSLPAWAGSFTGTWTAEGASLTLKQTGKRVSGSGQVGEVSGTLSGVVVGNRLSGTYTSPGTTGSFVGQLSAAGLAVTFDGGEPILFSRGGQAARSTASEEPERPAPAQLAPAGGTKYQSEMDGWEVRCPSAWKYAVQGSRLLLGSDTEAGAIFVWFSPVTYEQMEQAAAQGYHEQGISLLPSGPSQELKLKAGRALAVNASGTSPDGAELQARAVGVAGPRGAVAVLGVTTAQHFATLRARVDAVAASVSFFTPKVSPAAQNLAGGWWHWSGSNSSSTGSFGSYSRERRLALCADGRFFDSSSSDVYVSNTNTNTSSDYYGSQATGSMDSQRAGSGRWNASGNNGAGTLRLSYANGNVQELSYRFTKPNDIELNGSWFGRDPDTYAPCR